jgi:hypothetical protein
MTAIIPGVTAITANGEYSIRPDFSSSLMQIKGVMDGASAIVGHVDEDGDFSPFLKDDGSATTIANPGTIMIPTSYKLAIKVSGAGGSTDFKAILLPIK